MKVGFDITVLAQGLRDQRYRTGIHRVVENVYPALESQAGVEVSPVCCEASEIIHAERYLHETGAAQQSVYSLLSPEDDRLVRERVGFKAELVKFNESLSDRFSLQTYIKRKQVKSKLRRLPKSTGRISLDTLGELDIYHSPYLPLEAELLNQSGAIPFFTVHDLILLKHPELFKGNEQAHLSHYLSHLSGKEWVTCISEATRADLLEVNPHLDPAQVSIAYLAAGEHFRPCNDRAESERVREQYNLPEGPYFLSLSTLEPRKNILAVIRAFTQLIRSGECSDASLVLVGGLGWDYDLILKEIEGVDALKDRIILTGFVDDADLAAIYSGAITFLYMSLYEGFGLPPLEAMQCGVPVITSNNSSLPEVVGDAGILLDAHATDELAQAMLNFYRDESLREAYSKKSIVRATHFSWQACVTQLVGAYQQAIESK